MVELDMTGYTIKIMLPKSRNDLFARRSVIIQKGNDVRMLEVEELLK